jgi:hypothetical protein
MACILPASRRVRRAVVFLAGPRGLLAIVLLGLLAAAPALRVGLGGHDDLVQRARLSGRSVAGLPPVKNILIEFFDFFPESARATMLDTGYLPWWTHPRLTANALRPLSAATHVLDYALWPDAIPLQHLHTLIWYAGAIVVTLLLVRRICGDRQVAALAALLFAVSDTHALPVAWLCNRNALVCFVLGGLAIYAHHRWRVGGRRGERAGGGAGAQAVALGASAAALLAGEAALGAMAYIAAYQLFVDRGSAVRRLLRLAPYGLLVVGWQICYRVFGFGSLGSDHYQDPGAVPLVFLRNLGERIPLLLLGQWTRISADLPGILPRPWQLAMVGLALGVVGLLVLLFRRQLREEPEARFWAGGMLLAMVPVCAVFPMDRQLLFPGLGAFALLARQAARLGWIGESGPAPASPLAPLATVPRAARVAVGALLVIHLLVAAVALPLRIEGWSRMLRWIDRADQAIPRTPAVAGQSVFWLIGYDFGNISVIAGRAVGGAPAPRASHVLSSYTTGVMVSRRDARTLVVQPDGGFLANAADRLMRSFPPPFRRGDRFSTSDYSATVEEVTPDGRPRRVCFRFSAPLEDPAYRWLYLGDGFHARGFRLPRVGEEVRLPAPRWRERRDG